MNYHVVLKVIGVLAMTFVLCQTSMGLLYGIIFGLGMALTFLP